MDIFCDETAGVQAAGEYSSLRKPGSILSAQLLAELAGVVVMLKLLIQRLWGVFPMLACCLCNEFVKPKLLLTVADVGVHDALQSVALLWK